MTWTRDYLNEAVEILNDLDTDEIDQIIAILVRVRDRQGRLFIVGVGGSAATASHAVNDFRKIAGIETYAPTDNVAELTARTNDEGWSSTFIKWLRVSRLNRQDALLVLSVGGSGMGVSENIVRAVDYAESQGTPVLGIVGRDGGHTRLVASGCLVIPPLFAERITPHTEGLASVILHLIVSHPALCSQ